MKIAILFMLKLRLTYNVNLKTDLVRTTLYVLNLFLSLHCFAFENVKTFGRKFLHCFTCKTLSYDIIENY